MIFGEVVQVVLIRVFIGIARAVGIGVAQSWIESESRFLGVS